MTHGVWDTLLNEVRSVHNTNAVLSEFCAFPDDTHRKTVTPHNVPAADLFAGETGFETAVHEGLHRALLSAGPYARWRETYKDTNIGQDFMDRFGCYCLIGEGGAFDSDHIRAWMTYMPPNLHYTWHHHEAEEAYLVVAGNARFFRHGEADVTLTAGQTMLHHSNQPHAMETGDDPVLCYVIWRNGFGQIPILTSADDLA